MFVFCSVDLVMKTYFFQKCFEISTPRSGGYEMARNFTFALKLKIKLVSAKNPLQNEHDLCQSWKPHKNSTKKHENYG